MSIEQMPTPDETTKLHRQYLEDGINRLLRKCKKEVQENFTGTNTVEVANYDFGTQICPDEAIPEVIERLKQKGWSAKLDHHSRTVGPRVYGLTLTPCDPQPVSQETTHLSKWEQALRALRAHIKRLFGK